MVTAVPRNGGGGANGNGGGIYGGGINIPSFNMPAGRGSAGSRTPSVTPYASVKSKVSADSNKSVSTANTAAGTPTAGVPTRPAVKENGAAIPLARITALEAEKEAERKRKKDCHCLPSVNCEGRVHLIQQKEKKLWVEYQLYIANLHSAFLFTHEGGMLTEWAFAGYNRWDGFWQPRCTLVEAKGRYEFLIRINKESAWKNELDRLQEEFGRQKDSIETTRRRPNGTRVTLEWHFKEHTPYKLFIELIKKPPEGISIHHTPFDDSRDQHDRKNKK